MKIPQEIQSFNPDEFDFDDKAKVKVSFLEYVEDIFSKRYSMPRLSTLILEKARVNSTSY